MKTPWSLIGWLLAGLIAFLLSLGLYYLGLTLGWRAWIAPAILWLPLLVAAVFYLVGWLLARPKAPSVPVLDPSNPFTGPWEAIKSGLGEGAWELYLVVGDDDEAKRSFLSRALGQAEYQAAPAGPDGLSLWAAEGRAWLNVPAALWYEQARSEGQAVPGGDWGHLLKLLPGFPGRLCGLMVLADPGKIHKNPEIQGGILARKLGGLAALPEPVPSWWLVLYPLESLPSGQRLAEALNRGATDGEMWRRPFGLFLDDEEPPLTLPQRLTQAQSFLAGRLERHLEQIDRWPGRPSLSGEIFAFRDEFRRLPLDYFSAEAGGRKKTIRCDGLFLALEAPRSPGQFNELLLRNLIPGRRTEGGASRRQRSRRLIRGGVGLVFLTVLGALVVGHWQGRRALTLAAEAFPVLSQIERHPAAPPPVASLAVGTDLVLRLDERASGLAGLYGAPKEAADQARRRLAGQLRRHLPRDAAQSAPFMAALAGWADPGTAPLVFEYAEWPVAVPGFAAGAGRARVADLAARWDSILIRDGLGGSESERLLSHYDRMVFDQWRYKAEESVLALEPTPERVRSSGRWGLQGQLVGLEFLDTAGSELSFRTAREIPGWITAARELAVLDSLNDLGDLDGGGRELASILERIKRGGPNLGLGADGMEKVIAAAKAWKKYETAAYGLSDLVGSPQGLILLAGEMFSGAPAPPERASVATLRQSGVDALAALDKVSPIPSLPEQALFETLFLSPAEWIEHASVAAAAVALEEEWHRKIVLPSKDLSEEEKVALLLGEDGAVAAFRDGPARPYLDAGPRGYRPREALGREFPWSGEFLRFINASQERWKKVAGSDGRLNLTARLRPVRAEGDRLSSHPLGVALEMTCGAEEFRVETYNQPAVFNANWSPETCEPLKVTLIFRDFKLTKSYEGVAGFTAFVKAAVRGEIRLMPDDFPGQRHLMQAVGAEAVTVSLDVNKGREILKALTTPTPVLKPPASIISGNWQEFSIASPIWSTGGRVKDF